MEWAKTSDQDVGMLLLDFEKAYDRVEWPFPSMTLEAFGFPTKFAKWSRLSFMMLWHK